MKQILIALSQDLEKIIQTDSLAKKLDIATYTHKLVENPKDFLHESIDSLTHFGLKLLLVIVLYIVGSIIIRWIKNSLKRFFKKRNTEQTVASFTVSLTSVALTVLLIVSVVGLLGINTTSIAALFAAGGMAIGMALTGTLQNFAGGLMILIFKPFKAGDQIKTQNYEGFVSSINIVSTRIRTFNNSIVVMPNGALFNSNLTNVSETKAHRVTWKVGVCYGVDSQKVREVILDILNRDTRILHANNDNPIISNPAVNLSALNDSSVEFYVKAWTSYEDYWSVFYEVLEKIYTELPKQGIDFPFPQLDVHLHKNEN